MNDRIGQTRETHYCVIYSREQVEVLLQNGSAYRCFCSDHRLDLLRREALRLRQVPKYDNKCRHLSKEDINDKLKRGEPYCIRFKVRGLRTIVHSENQLIWPEIFEADFDRGPIHGLGVRPDVVRRSAERGRPCDYKNR